MKERKYFVVEDVMDENCFGVKTPRTKITLGKETEDGSLIWENSIWTSDSLGVVAAMSLLKNLFDVEITNAINFGD